MTLRCPESRAASIPLNLNGDYQLRPSLFVADGLVFCEKSKVIEQDFVIGGESADSQSNGP
jgi:hypothetical protein